MITSARFATVWASPGSLRTARGSDGNATSLLAHPVCCPRQSFPQGLHSRFPTCPPQPAPSSQWRGLLLGLPKHAIKGRRRTSRCRAVSQEAALANRPDHGRGSQTESENELSLLRVEDLWTEIARIAVPAGLALVADPAASLCDTYFLGTLGSTSLAAVGVSISIFNMIAKLLNIPLLNMTTSFVAEAGAQSAAEVAELGMHPDVTADIQSVNWTGEYSDFAEAMQVEATVDCDDDDEECLLEQAEQLQERARQVEQMRRMLDSQEGTQVTLLPKPQKPVNKAVSAALILGAGVGLVEALILGMVSGPVLGAMGVPVLSDMRGPAQRYLSLRAVGAPALVLGLAIQGAFRGFGDTQTPLFCTVLGNMLNIALLPLLMFQAKLGIDGAALATVLSQYIVTATLLVRMSKKVKLLPDKLSDLSFNRFLKAGGLLLGRTLSVLFTMTLATSQAARLGTSSMAAHQICLQVWLAASLLSDALALAGQTLLARAFAQKDRALVYEAAKRILLLGCILGLGMAGVFLGGQNFIPGRFTKDGEVLKVVSQVMPYVILTQPVNAFAFIWDGLLYGASDFAYSAYSMLISAAPAVLVLAMAPPKFGLPGVWMGLATIMSMRAVMGFVRSFSGSGPWQGVMKTGTA